MGNFIRAHPDFRVIAIGAPVRTSQSAMIILEDPPLTVPLLQHLTLDSLSILRFDLDFKLATSTLSRRPKFFLGKSRD